MSSKIAFLPVLASQKGFFNFKELTSQFTSFVNSAAKAIVDSEEELTIEAVQAFILEAANTIYSSTTTKSGGRKKDPAAPKQAKSAYIFFCTAKREEVKAANPEMSSKDITKELGKMWGELSEEEKVPFVKQHDEDKVRYEAEKKDYKSSSESDSETETEKPKKAEKKPKKVAEKKTTEKKEEKKPAEKKADSKKKTIEKKEEKKTTEKKADSKKKEEPKPSEVEDAAASGFELDKADSFCKNRTTAELLDFVRQHIENPESQKPALSKWKKTELIAKALEFMEEMDVSSF